MRSLRSILILVPLSFCLGACSLNHESVEQAPSLEASIEYVERPEMTAAQCQAEGGAVVGDIGDGRIHRHDYLCENGKPPIGSIVPQDGEPVAIEGAVCCMVN